MIVKTSSIPHFRDLDLDGRRRLLAEICALDPSEIGASLEDGGIEVTTADQMVENAIGTLALPFGVALNFMVNGVDHLVPMAIEEPSVIAAASNSAKRVRASGGFRATADPPRMVAQVEVHGVGDPDGAVLRLGDARMELLALADGAVPGLVERGGGARDLEARHVGAGFVVAHLVIDVCDAMGANLLNTIAEAVGPRVAELAGGELGLRILSNYADRRLVHVTARIPVEHVGSRHASGRQAAMGVVSASRFAELDPYRAVTHNKGIMNGVDAVVVATGNDWRAVEAAAHAYASRTGTYAPLATWSLVDHDETLEGSLTMPLALGIVGGALRAHRGARLALELMGVRSSGELAMVVAAAGLASNLAALRALSCEGIQHGHMGLHRRATEPPRPPSRPPS
jgi:hydroxymethylglutaryl-CoA reductase